MGLKINPLDPVPEANEAEVLAALQRLVANEGREGALRIAVAGIKAALGVDEATARTILDAVIRDVAGAEPVNPPVVPSPSGQMIFLGLTRRWSNTPPVETANVIKAARATGRSYELIELEGDEVNTPDKMTAYLLGQVAKIIPHLRADKAAGLRSKVWMYNTNASRAVCPSVSQFKRVFDAIAPNLDNALFCPFNESDTNTPAMVREPVEQYIRSVIQRERLFYTEKRVGWAKHAEYHPASTSSWPSDKDFVTPDNGPTLRQLGADIGQTPNISAWRNYAREARKRGYHFDAYSFYESFPAGWINAVMEGWSGEHSQPATTIVDEIDVTGATWGGSNNQVDASAARITVEMKRAKIEGGNVRVDYNPPASWWGSESDHLKFPRGLAAWREGSRVYVAHYDWFRRGQSVKTIGNLTNGYTRRPVGTVYFAIMSNDQSERTNFVAGGAM